MDTSTFFKKTKYKHTLSPHLELSFLFDPKAKSNIANMYSLNEFQSFIPQMKFKGTTTKLATVKDTKLQFYGKNQTLFTTGKKSFMTIFSYYILKIYFISQK